MNGNADRIMVVRRARIGRTVSNEVLDWVKQKNRPDYNLVKDNPIRIADFFSGCGGLSLGVIEAAHRANRAVDIRIAVDFDRDAIAVYNANLRPGCPPIPARDITKVYDGIGSLPATDSEKAIQRHCGELDAIVAGPPCQGHSDLNNSTRRNDPRNELYLCAVRAAIILKPKVVFIENVPAVIHSESGVVQSATKMLQLADYTVTSAVIDTQSLGLPQRRRRHILFASQFPRISIDDLLPTTQPGLIVPVGPFLSGLENEPELSTSLIGRPARITMENARRINYLFKRRLYDLPDSSRPPCHRDKDHSYQSVYGRMHWNRPAQTVTSGFGSMGQGRYVHPRRKRLITPHEAARIQGFPDFYDFSPARGLTALRTMIGNAVPPPVMITLMGALLKSGIL